MSDQMASQTGLLKDVLVTVSQLLSTIGDIKLSGNDDNIGLKASMKSYQETLRAILPRIQVCSGEKQDANTGKSIVEQTRMANVVVNDTLLRLDALCGDKAAPGQSQAELFDEIWSGESIRTLEECISCLRAEIQDTQNGTIVGSRVLWTGPLQRQQEPQAAARSELDNHLVAEEIPVDLRTSIKDTLANNDKAELVQEFILERLTFTNIKAREEEVSQAHRETFQWALTSNAESKVANERRNNFVAWLNNESQSQIYWINGKAGSGKSTLLRFIVEHGQTMKHLRNWAGDTPILVLKYFFWTAGSVLQRSHSGLLRSLLYQLLDQRRDLIAWSFPELWMKSQDTKRRVQMTATWETEELLQGLYRAFSMVTKDTKLCLFVDGLDEFEGNEEVIINLVRDIVNLSSNIRACISSRPWAAFEKAFQNVPQMLLQELTRADMDGFISAEMSDNRYTRHLMELETPKFDQLKTEILHRAQGVFLWTSLALRSLLRNMDKDSTIDQMNASILQLPPDLEDLFEHLLFNDGSTTMLERQSHAFQIVRARDNVCNFTGDESVRAITLYQMALAHEGELDDIQSELAEADAKHVLAKCQRLTSILEDDCVNLLVLGSHDRLYERTHSTFGDAANGLSLRLEAGRTIHYLHRTIRDFFEYSGVWSRIIANGGPHYDPHQALLLSHILKLRSPLEPPRKHRHLDDWWHDDVVPAMTHARYASPRTAETRTQLLDTLNETLDACWKKKPLDEQDTWARNAFGSFEVRMKHKTPFHHPFLSLSAKFGLADYLKIKLADKSCAYKAGIPLLSHALELLVDRRKTVYPLSSEEVIAVLLEKGESPNQVYQDMFNKTQTPWLMALRYVREGVRRGWVRPYDIRSQGTRRWVRVLDLMLDHGADPKAVIPADKWDPEITASGVVSSVVCKYYSSDAHQLERKLLDKMSTGAIVSLPVHTDAGPAA